MHVVDIGSSAVKVYETHENGRSMHIHTISWNVLGRRDSIDPALELERVFAELENFGVGTSGDSIAIGTAAMRRSPALNEHVAIACKRAGLAYQLVSQEEEAKLIRIACADQGISEPLVVNAGGGSIQIVELSGGVSHLLGFGIADINHRFSLHCDPSERCTVAAIEWLETQLPSCAASFCYTGGERSYLLKWGVELAQDGRCSADAFSAFAHFMDKLPQREIEERSPFDSRWMQGAIASNCIVLALLNKANAIEFRASDFNVADGLVKVLAEAVP